jgi:hypothetical protein
MMKKKKGEEKECFMDAGSRGHGMVLSHGSRGIIDKRRQQPALKNPKRSAFSFCGLPGCCFGFSPSAKPSSPAGTHIIRRE